MTEKDFTFVPAIISVPVGGTVVWTNVGPTIHTVAAADNSWSSEVLQKGQTFRFTFKQAGTVAYICSIHPFMKATIVVK